MNTYESCEILLSTPIPQIETAYSWGERKMQTRVAADIKMTMVICDASNGLYYPFRWGIPLDAQPTLERAENLIRRSVIGDGLNKSLDEPPALAAYHWTISALMHSSWNRDDPVFLRLLEDLDHLKD